MVECECIVQSVDESRLRPLVFQNEIVKKEGSIVRLQEQFSTWIIILRTIIITIIIKTAASRHWMRGMWDESNTSSLVSEVSVWAWDLD